MTTPTRRGLPELGELETEHGLRAISTTLPGSSPAGSPRRPSTGSSACSDACPIYPGKRYLDWELDGPAGQSVERVRAIRYDIDRRIRELLAELVPTPNQAGPFW